METIKDNKKISWFDVIIFSMLAFYPELMKYIWTVLNMFTSVVGLKITTTAISSIVWIAIVFVFLNCFVKRLSVYDIVFYIAFLLFISAFYFFPSHGKFTTDRYIDFVFKIIPYYFVGRVYRYEDNQKKIIMILATITLTLSIYYTFNNIAQGEERLEDDMYAAYMILPTILVLLCSFFDKKLLIFTPVAVAGFVFLLSLGTRGPILCILVFITIMLAKKMKAKRFIALVCVGAVMIGMFISSSLFSKTLISIAHSFEKMGLSSRIVTYALEENITDDTGRNSIKNSIIKQIERYPLDVNGPYYDWAIVSADFEKGHKPVEQKGTYAHNFFLEMWAQYGVFLGSVFSIVVLWLILRLIIKTKREMIFIPATVVCFGFVKLMISSSYILEGNFFFLLGLSLSKYYLKSDDKSINNKLMKEENL